MHNKIIKYALVLLATASSIFAWNYTKAYETITDCYKFTSGGVKNTCYLIQPGEEVYINGEYNSIDNNINFLDGSGNKIRTFKNYNGKTNASWFWNNNKLIFVQNSITNWNYFIARENKYFCQINSLNNEEIMNTCGVIQFQGNKNYNWDNYNVELNTILENFNGNNVSEILFAKYDTNYGGDINNVLCFKYNNLSSTFCIHSPGTVSSSYGLQGNWFIEIENNGMADGTSTLQKYGDILGTSPFAGGGNGGGSNTGTQVNTGKICPMIQFEIDMYGRKYNTGLCYTNSIEFTGGTVQTVQPQSIFEIFNSYTEYVNRYNLRNNNCHAPYTQEHCNNAMSEKRRSIQIFNKIEKAGVDSEKVYQYCHLQLDFTEEEKWNLGTCQIETETDKKYYATGVNEQGSNPNPLEGITDALQEGVQEPPVPEDGTVFDEILPEGVLTWKDVLMDYNFYSHFATLYTKITKLFQARGTTEDGIIPPYITSILLLVILFKLYKK